ncbi:hypothetical protein RN96_07675 [Fusobacterium polymorphum]|uniref:Uncharacterized protein n=1 Tax=Fusobacterium nucleatum subsp. polymorphum TaxID=76857 RepID=A0A2B7YJC0_FUSNP|nr:hypothetical protein [Fusobacterium polymorphum]PGH20948.1 hypothetical protein RN96_07675 [Fusobacterium polymorphum]
MEKEKNTLYLENVNKIVERAFNSKKPEIEIEKVIEKPFETLINESKILLNIKKEIEITLKNADDAKKEVMRAGTNDNKDSFFSNPFSKTYSEDSMIKIQEATYYLSDVVINITKNQTIFWDYLKKISEITKFLFNLGISNIATNNIVVNYLEKKLSDASKEELDDLAREEIENVVKRLKKQQELESRYEDFKKHIKEEMKEYQKLIFELTNEFKILKEEIRALKK